MSSLHCVKEVCAHSQCGPREGLSVTALGIKGSRDEKKFVKWESEGHPQRKE